MQHSYNLVLSAAVGIADDLPNRFAFEQLNALSGMASKVGAGVRRSSNCYDLFGTAVQRMIVDF